MNYEQLKRDIVQNGQHRYHQIWRDDNCAVYEQFGLSGKLIGYEIIVIKKQQACYLFGRDYPAKEIYPNSEDWGNLAWSRNEKQSALQLGRDLSARCANGEFKTRIGKPQKGDSASRGRQDKTDSALAVTK